MKVCFIIPSQPELEKPLAYISLGVAYLGAVLERRNHDVQIHDMNIDGDIFPAADIYGVTCPSATFPRVREIVRGLHSQTVIVGGVHPSIQPEDFDDLNCYVVTGEAEDTLGKLIEPGARPTKVVTAGLIEDIDKLPFPARHLFKNVVDYSGIHGQETGTGATTILSSRGCPYQCAFCTRIPQTRKMRFHSPAYMVNELKAIISEYSVRHFRFVDDIFTLNRDRVMAFCEQVIDEHLNITWICITRGNTLDEDLLRTMKRAGCVETHIGVESGSQRVLSLMNKRITVESLGNAIKLIKGAGIKAKVYLMYGFPGETDGDRQMTIEFVKRNRPDKVTISKFTALPGSKLWNHGRITPEQWFYQDHDLVYQEFRNRIHEAMGENNAV